MRMHIQLPILVLLALMVAGGPVWAQTQIIYDWPVAVQGQPAVQVRTQPSYFVWVDSAGWHVRWTTPFPHLFSGMITTNGEIRSLQRAGGAAPAWLTRAGQRIVFATPTYGGIDGFDFQTSGTAVTFSLALNSFQARVSQVFLGRAGITPSTMPFTVVMEPILAQQSATERIYGADVREAVERAREENR